MEDRAIGPLVLSRALARWRRLSQPLRARGRDALGQGGAIDANEDASNLLRRHVADGIAEALAPPIET